MPHTSHTKAVIVPRSFYLMRHGETTDVEEHLVSGSGSDPDLTEKGAAEVAEKREIFELLGITPSRVVVTPSRRTRESAQILFGEDVWHYEESGLGARNLGELDGHVHERSVLTRNTDLLPNEETKEAQSVRVLEALNRQLNKEPLEEKILFISHQGSMRRIFEMMGKANIQVKPGALYECLPVAGGWKLFSLSLAKDEKGEKYVIKDEVFKSTNIDVGYSR